MRLLCVVHHDNAAAGVFGDVPAQLGEWRPAGGEPAPDRAGYDAVMVFGGSMNADQEEAHPWLATEKAFLRDLLAREVPLLGVCLGAQLLAEVAGARPVRAREPEIGWRRMEVTPEGATDPLIGPLAPAFEVFSWHSYEAPLPPGARPLATSPVCLQAYRVDGLAAWGLQFHSEVTLADANEWIDDYGSDPDAVSIGLDQEALRAETHERIGAQNELGRALARRFVACAGERLPG